jgi:hypothetical protein
MAPHAAQTVLFSLSYDGSISFEHHQELTLHKKIRLEATAQLIID